MALKASDGRNRTHWLVGVEDLESEISRRSTSQVKSTVDWITSSKVLKEDEAASIMTILALLRGSGEWLTPSQPFSVSEKCFDWLKLITLLDPHVVLLVIAKMASFYVCVIVCWVKKNRIPPTHTNRHYARHCRRASLTLAMKYIHFDKNKRLPFSYTIYILPSLC